MGSIYLEGISTSTKRNECLANGYVYIFYCGTCVAYLCWHLSLKLPDIMKNYRWLNLQSRGVKTISIIVYEQGMPACHFFKFSLHHCSRYPGRYGNCEKEIFHKETNWCGYVGWHTE